jgi:hypothetical protein
MRRLSLIGYSAKPKKKAELRWLAPPKPTGLVFRPVCFKRKGQKNKKGSAVLACGLALNAGSNGQKVATWLHRVACLSKVQRGDPLPVAFFPVTRPGLDLGAHRCRVTWLQYLSRWS